MFENLSFGATPQVAAAPAQSTEVLISINKFFDFEKQKVQELSLDQLRRTNKENRGDDRSCPHGIYHFSLIEQIMDMCDQHGLKADVYDLFATNNRDKQTPGVSLYPELEQRYGERAIEAHTLRRIYANIRLSNWDNEELTTNLAVSYTQKGIQVGFGRCVKICHNMNMMGEGRFVSDYSVGNMRYAHGDEYKTDLHGIMRQIGKWLTDAEYLVIQDDETIDRMKNSVLTAEQLYTILGILLTTRVTHDTTNKEIRNSSFVYPLNQAQISSFTESLLIKQKEEGHITAWSFYNCATELYKPKSCETNLILPMNLAMSEFMKEHELY